MQTRKVLLPVGTFLATIAARAQGTIQNLDFESANVSSTPSNQAVQVLATDALPGWTAYVATYQQSQVWYNGLSLGGALISVIDRHILYYANRLLVALDSPAWTSMISATFGKLNGGN